jgi:hypothetical protein
MNKKARESGLMQTLIAKPGGKGTYIKVKQGFSI